MNMEKLLDNVLRGAATSFQILLLSVVGILVVVLGYAGVLAIMYLHNHPF